jgi:ankyrin repeat protein
MWEFVKIILNHPAIGPIFRLDVITQVLMKSILHHCALDISTPKDLLELLLSKGANPITTDVVGNTPLHDACKVAHLHAVEKFLTFRPLLFSRNRFGKIK